MAKLVAVLLAIFFGLLALVFILEAWMKADSTKQCEQQYGLQYWSRDGDQCVNKTGEVRYLK